MPITRFFLAGAVAGGPGSLYLHRGMVLGLLLDWLRVALLAGAGAACAMTW